MKDNALNQIDLADSAGAARNEQINFEWHRQYQAAIRKKLIKINIT